MGGQERWSVQAVSMATDNEKKKTHRGSTKRLSRNSTTLYRVCMRLKSSTFTDLKSQSDINVTSRARRSALVMSDAAACDTGDGNEGRTHLRVQVADQQDADAGGQRGEPHPGSPGQGERGQGSRQSGDRHTCRGEEH